MEERKLNKKAGTPLEGMMAYLDENGNLTDTPPDPNRKKTFALEEIQITVPKQEHAGANEPRTGTIAFFNDAKGFGFINESLGKERIFFHVKDLLEQVAEADKVSFTVERGPRGLSAVNVSKIK